MAARSFREQIGRLLHGESCASAGEPDATRPCATSVDGPAPRAPEATQPEPEQTAAEPCGPITRAVLDYWRKCRGHAGLPSRADIDPVDIPKLLPNLLLVDVRHDPIDFRYRLLGTEIVSHSVRDYTGMRLADLPEQRFPSRIWTLYEAVATERTPSALQVPYLLIPGQSVEIFAAPLSGDGRRVDMLLGAVEFPPEVRGIPREELF